MEELEETAVALSTSIATGGGAATEQQQELHGEQHEYRVLSHYVDPLPLQFGNLYAVPLKLNKAVCPCTQTDKDKDEEQQVSEASQQWYLCLMVVEL